MIHGPCGPFNPKAPCMVDGKCSKEFPKDLQEETQENVDGYPRYKRTNNQTFELNGVEIDSRWVVPHNPYLLLKYNAHINVESCSSIKAIQYVHKYVFKGPDMANVELKDQDQARDHDEISEYVDGRYVTPHEALWHLFGFKMHDKSHHIERLAIHLPMEQWVQFREGEEFQALELASRKDTSLTAYFKLNEADPEARNLLYQEVGEQYIFSNYKWKKRQRGFGTVISRMYMVSPLDRERYCLRLLLLKRRGCLSFNDLKTIDGTLEETFVQMPGRSICNSSTFPITRTFLCHLPFRF